VTKASALNWARLAYYVTQNRTLLSKGTNPNLKNLKPIKFEKIGPRNDVASDKVIWIVASRASISYETAAKEAFGKVKSFHEAESFKNIESSDKEEFEKGLNILHTGIIQLRLRDGGYQRLEGVFKKTVTRYKLTEENLKKILSKSRRIG